MVIKIHTIAFNNTGSLLTNFLYHFWDVTKDIFQFVFLQTAFVRQKTPHPKELKAKAHKLFGNKKPIDESNQENSELKNGDADVEIPVTNISTLESEPVSQSRAFFSETEPVVIENQINNAVAFQEQEEDDEEVRDTFFFKFEE